jgi:hypothetical protein
MQRKKNVFNATHSGMVRSKEPTGCGSEQFDYGPMNRLSRYRGTHPRVMREKIEAMDWKHQLRNEDPPGLKREPHKDEKLKNRVLTYIEKQTGFDLGNKNWRKLLKV